MLHYYPSPCLNTPPKYQVLDPDYRNNISFLLPVETIVDLSPTYFIGLLKALVPSVLMNIYVVGLNQLFDVEIDKVNKPYLPLASGKFSMATGILIVSASLLLSLYMGITFQSPPLLAALLISFALGSVYSIELPFLRWKKHAFLAASCILIVRAMVVQLAFFVHIQKFVLGKSIFIPRSLMFATAFMCFFSAVIALFKDIPDVEGDRDYGIQSFSVSLGQERWPMVLLSYTELLLLLRSYQSSLSQIKSQLKMLARPMYSNPPAHGASVVANAAGNPTLFNEWKAEMEMMAGGIKVDRNYWMAFLQKIRMGRIGLLSQSRLACSLSQA
ncbi:hypothetical protein GH714_039464 [Hevea brasiliensis]|uniref:Homogentisate phytyltransferase n=1 Tax=Hevea brasiliensis TaxID=3981 RepID=A0A6A6KEA0_HEVBR|nr:hypothetical protein GH714_039464 [Hevea brasiliensis]